MNRAGGRGPWLDMGGSLRGVACGAPGAPGAEPLADTLGGQEGSGLSPGSSPECGYRVTVLLVAMTGDGLVLVEQVGGDLVDRATGRVLDPTGIVLVGLDVGELIDSAA